MQKPMVDPLPASVFKMKNSSHLHEGMKSTEPLNLATLDVEEKPSDSDNLNGQTLSTKEERMVPSQDASIGPVDVNVQLGSTGAGGDRSTVYSPSVYAPQAQTFYYGGYENTTGEWGEYRHYVGPESLDGGSPGVFNDNPSLMFHTGYGYNPQMPYGPYSPVTTPLPSVRGDGQLYSQQQFPFSGPPYYQQSIPPTMPFITAPTPASQGELTMPVGIDQQGDGVLFGPRTGGPPQFGSFGRGGGFAGNTGNSGFYDLRQGFDGFGSGGLWSDWAKSPDGQRSFTPFLSPAASPQPLSTLGSLGRNVGMASQQQRHLYGFGSGSSSYAKSYPNNGIHQSSSFGSASVSSFGMNDRWLTIDKARRRARDNVSSCGCNSTPDILSEQNRGPRASKPKSQITTEHASPVDGGKNVSSAAEACSETYNRPDFVTEYEDAKFFIIKSYSEDNVHKSIKYGVWASTPNGNRKLDAAYREAKEKQSTCPVFLFFSVNASAQFCGVAEMVGPVDFDRSVNYWQQDKWSGQFPVKWHIIKDVPNSQFRHIILENNDNKPVTNSRDTQEVKLEQGLEMLSILKSYETDLSILDDFDFYEQRQKAMQERKARQQQQQGSSLNNQTSHPVVGGNEQRSAVVTSEYIKHLPKSFAQVVRLEESNNKQDLKTEKGGSATTDSMGNGLKPEDSTEQLRAGG
ncbi:YTH domain [Macleaya cordata]|uniref:YTH domain-containing family protein n=1 Tax=Macleaya cordata TaxID=56857 RepID=A0A200R9C6_MACCD|nr:YTH domain [Macleaya cordata]